MKSETLRLGGGAGFSADRVDAARQLVEKGALDYIIFECIAERTLALGIRNERAIRIRATHPGWNGVLKPSCRCAPKTARA